MTAIDPDDAVNGSGQTQPDAPGAIAQPGAGATAGPTDDGSPEARRITDAGIGMLVDGAQPGQAAAGNYELRQADAVFSGPTSFGGDNVNGPKIVIRSGPGGRSMTALHLAPERIELIRHAFVRGRGYADMTRRCAGRRLTILRAPRGTGKGAAALRLLIDGRHQQIVAYESDASPVEIGPSIVRNAGHLVENLHERRCVALSGLTLEDLEKQLHAAGASLVMTVAESAVFGDAGVHKYVVDLGAPPTHREILFEQLRYLVGPAEADNLLSDAQLIGAFDDHVPADAPRSRVAAFVDSLVDLRRRGGRLDVDLLRARLKNGVAAEAEGWFAALDKLADKCLAIALALLDGLPYQTVAATAESLQRRLDPPLPSGSLNQPPRPNPFDDTRAARLVRLRATVTQADVVTRKGPMPTEIVRFLESAYPRAVLLLVWREHDSVRQELVRWLGDLANHPDRAVRVRAARAVGMFAVGAFGPIHDAVLRPWAMSNNARQREMAAYALKEPGRRPVLRRQVAATVDEWSRSSSWQLQATTARVYGSALGAASIDRSLDVLERLAAIDNAAVAFAVGYSLAELVDADQALAGKVLQRVLTWMTDRQRLRNATGELAFITMAADLVAPDAGTGSDTPLLLLLAEHGSATYQVLVAAWRVTLNSALMHGAAQSVAGEWAELVEPGARGRDALVALLAAVADGSDRTRRIVLGLARDWRGQNGRRRAPRTAEAVLAALNLPR